MLCEVCRRCLEGMHDPALTPRIGLATPPPEKYKENPMEVEKYVYGHHRTRQSAETSSFTPCFICSYHSSWFDNDRGRTIDYFTTFKVLYKFNCLRIYWLHNSGGRSETLLLPVGEAEPDKLTVKLSDNTGGPLAWKLMVNWVKDCNKNHKKCHLNGTRTFLPTWLLKVGLPSGLGIYLPTRLLEIDSAREPPTYRLILRSECRSDTRYIALSYAWGTDSIRDKLRLLHSTYEELRQGKSVDDLPKTFRDTVKVALHLGIHYIWIDSICIFQDSEEDWKYEAATMQDVYRNAYVTISALHGANDHAGLFHDRDATAVGPTIVKVKLSADQEPLPFVCYRENDQLRETSRSFGLNSNLITRAWCVQERLVSPRVLHFGAQQVFWECHEKTASECYPMDALRTSHVSRILGKQLIRDISTIHKDRPNDLTREVYSEWIEIVYMFSRGKLTVSSDKLVAISGLAEAMRRVLREKWPKSQHRYFAGLWEGDLRYSLCWVALRPGKRALYYRAPTWSWASIDGTIDVEPRSKRGESFQSRRHQNSEMTITMGVDEYWFISDQDCQAYTEYLGPSDTGQVSGGYLKLNGLLAIVDILPATQTSFIEVRCFRNLMDGVQLDGPVLDGNFHVFFDDKDETPDRAFFIPMHMGANRFVTFSRLHGLVLLRVKETEKYRRVGLLKGWVHSEEPREDVVRLFESLGRRTITVI